MAADDSKEGGCLWPAAEVSLESLASIIDHVAHPIFVKDRDSRFVLLNRAVCDLTGYAREEMLGKTDYDFFPVEEADFFRSKDLQLFETGSEVVIEEEPITDSRGERHILSTTKVPMRGPTGEATHLVGIIHDITRLKEVEQELRAANEDLERRVRERTVKLEAAHQELLRKERLAVLGQLAGGLAHQIRNPLGSINNAAFLLRRMLKGHPNDDVRSAVAIILEEASRTNEIITHLLDNARVRPAVPDLVCPLELLEQSVRSHPPGDGVHVVWRVPDGLPTIAVDAEQMRLALGHLLDNARDAMGGEGTLTLAARIERRTVVLSISDTGPGVPDEVRDRIFAPLVTTKPSALGLGLTTTRTLVEAQGGSLRWESSPDEGTRFEIALPAGD